MVKFRSTSEIKFYLYVSTLKIEMLYEQISNVSKRSLKKSISVKTPFIAGSYESSTENVISRDDKLRAVEEKLSERRLIGTPEQPRDYFKGTVSMRWGLFDDYGIRPENEAPLVFFGGFDKSIPLIVGLGGSSIHVVGHEGATSTHSRSSARVLTRWLMSGVRDDRQPELPGWKERHSEENEVLEGVAIALHYLRPPTQRLEFLAKTLLTGTLYSGEHFTGLPEAKVLLGTPLYVAQERHLPDENRFGLDSQW